THGAGRISTARASGSPPAIPRTRSTRTPRCCWPPWRGTGWSSLTGPGSPTSTRPCTSSDWMGVPAVATLHEMITAGLDGIHRDRARMDKIHRYHRGDHDDPYMPPSATVEYKLLAERSRANWVPLLVKTPAQTLSVTGYRTY